MEYNINSLGIQYNHFTNFTNPYFSNNFVHNSVVNQTPNQCFQCSDQPFIRTILPTNLSPYHMQSKCNANKFISYPKQTITNTTTPTITSSTPPSSSSAKLSSNFTIESILDINNKIANNNSENSSTHSSQFNNAINETINEKKNFIADNEKTIYNWLNCTRYKPPKVKKRSNSSDKRKAINRGPRIPFTSCQIRELENKFHTTHYLSSLEVTYLAQKLNLTDSRIRIWFQNRRARDKREKRIEDSPKEVVDRVVEEEDEELDEDLVVDSSSSATALIECVTNANTNYLDQQKKAPLVFND